MYGNLCRAAIQGGSVPELTLYHLAQSVRPSPGAHGIEQRVLMDEALRLGLFRSRRHLGVLLKAGHRRLWTLKAGRLWLYGVARIGEGLDAPATNAHRQTVGTSQLKTHSARRAAMLGVAIPGPDPISQRALRAMTGVSERSQRRYRARGAFTAVRQDADLTETVGIATDEGRRWWAYDHRGSGVYVARDRLKKRIPNSHQPRGARIPRGRRSREMFAARPRSMIADGTLTVPRVFFDSTRCWMRCRRLKLGRLEAEDRAHPFNWSYVRSDDAWKAVRA
ncbi:MAG: hypothetical protein WEC75_00270 [Dehalococcoidia bacterium]